MSARTRERFFRELRDPAQLTWKYHRDLIVRVDQIAAGFRGFVGLGAVVADNPDDQTSRWIYRGNQVFVADSDVTWFTLQDIKRAAWEGSRETHLAVIRRTTRSYDIPRIGDPQQFYDFRRMPMEGTTDPMVIDPVRDYQPTRIFNALNWACTSAAVHYSRGWSNLRSAFYDTLKLDDTGTPALIYGEGYYQEAGKPEQWLPIPYLGFPLARQHEIWRWVVQADPLLQTNVYHETLRDSFIASLSEGLPIECPVDGQVAWIDRRAERDGFPCWTIAIRDRNGVVYEIITLIDPRLNVSRGTTVKQGTIIGYDGPHLPADWHGMTNFRRWSQILPGIFARALPWVIRVWFMRAQRVIVPGYVHMPVTIAAPAALGCADTNLLFWDLEPSVEACFNAQLEAFIFPPIAVERWDQFKIPLTCDIELDLTPVAGIGV